MVKNSPMANAGLALCSILAYALLSLHPSLVAAQDACVNDVVISSSACDPTDEELCRENCLILDSTYLLDRCCRNVGVSAALLAFEPSELWVERLNEFNQCTGSNVRIAYLEGGESAMAEAVIKDVGLKAGEGEGNYDAYVVRAPWLPPIYSGLKGLSGYIKEYDETVRFYDFNQASRNAVSFDGDVYALPLDSNYIALGWRQDVFELHADQYLEMYGEELDVPNTIEELVLISERLNGLDHNDDDVPDWGFCLTPSNMNFFAFLAPVLQTYLHDCREVNTGEFDCDVGSNTEQNLFFDFDTFEPLIHNEGFQYAFELYYRFVKASNCNHSDGDCDVKEAFQSGRCAGVIALPSVLTQMLLEEGEHSIEHRFDDDGNEVWRPGQNLAEGEYWGRRVVFPGSTRVMDWKSPGRPLTDCSGSKCPFAVDGVNYSPFFSEGAVAYAINGRNAKSTVTDTVWDLIAWLSELHPGEVPLSVVYRQSSLTEEFAQEIARDWNNEVMAQDLHAVLETNFKSESDGGNPAQDLHIRGSDEYNEALDTEMHQNLMFADILDGGLFNTRNPAESLDPVRNKAEFERRFQKFVSNLQVRYDEINANHEGGALGQLEFWRNAHDLHPKKSKEDICSDLLASNQAYFDKLECPSVVQLRSLCQVQRDDVEEYSPGMCATSESAANTTTLTIILCSIFGGGFLLLGIYFFWSQMVKVKRIHKGHEQITEATLNESIRSLRQLDYPLHLIRGDEFISEEKLLRHEVLRNTHKLTVLDSLSDVDAFIDAGKHIVFLSHQWTSFNAPDASGAQYKAMCIALKELASQSGWDESLKDVFVWADFCCLPQANASIQNLAVRSLAAYAASATYFIIVAPETNHADLDEICDLATYQERMWTRAEQVCHSMRNGTDGMFITKGEAMPLVPVDKDFFKESLHVFDGELTCCRLEHKGMSMCDRQCLVIPLLGLYGELYRASIDEGKGGNRVALSSVEAFLTEIEEHQDSVFPPTFKRTTWRKNKQITEEVVLFGDLIARMRSRMKNGGGFAVDDDNTASMTTVGSDFIRHGADHIRHGAAGQGIRF